MRDVYRDILLFCPEVKTGGPEAIHQLAHRINRLGGQAKLVYYGAGSTLVFDGPTLRCDASASPMHAYFERYEPRAAQSVTPDAETLIIFPEALSHLAVGPSQYARAVWWRDSVRARGGILLNATV